jgi:hypothetical protein
MAVHGARREAMQQEKHMLEAQLLQTAGDVATAERELTGSQLSSLASARSSGMAYSSDSDESDVSAGGSGGSPHRHISHIRRLAELSAREVESLRAENDAIMKVRAKCLRRQTTAGLAYGPYQSRRQCWSADMPMLIVCWGINISIPIYT